MEFSQSVLNPCNPLLDSRISYLPETRFGAVPPTVWGNPLMSPPTVMTPKPQRKVIYNRPDSESGLTNKSTPIITPSLSATPKLLSRLMQIIFMFMIRLSGNLSFLNWLTMLPSIFCLNDNWFRWLFSKSTLDKVNLVTQQADRNVSHSYKLTTKLRFILNAIVGLTIAYLSIPIILNLFSTRQVMNSSFDAYRIVNTYGIEKLVKPTNGQLINYTSIRKYVSNTTTTTTHLCLEYGSCLEDNLHIANPDTQSITYNELSRRISKKLLTTDEFFETTHKHKQRYEEMINNGVVYPIQILRRIGAYIKSPNPYCKLFPYNNDILKWLVFIQGPPHTPFDDSVLIMEMVFEENFPIFPPKLRFLTLLYVSYSGNVCLPILSEDWNVGVSLKQVFDSLLMMLDNPIRSHFVRSKVADIYYTSRESYNSMASSLLDIKLYIIAG